MQQGGFVRSALPRLLTACWLAASGLLAGPVAAAPVKQVAENSTTSIAFQAFEHGFMFWRQDTAQLVVGYSEIRTKSGATCQELYRDTFHGQPYQIPPASPGLSVPQLGFGWLYASDQLLARRLGYATADEVSRVAEIRTSADATGSPGLAVTMTEPIPGVPNPLLLAPGDEPGLSYCFARGSEDRSVLNT